MFSKLATSRDIQHIHQRLYAVKGVYLVGVARRCNCLQRRQDFSYKILQLLWRLGARVLRPRFKQEIDLRSRTKKDMSDQESHIVGPRKTIEVVVW